MGCFTSKKIDFESQILELKTNNIELTEQQNKLNINHESLTKKFKKLTIDSANALDENTNRLHTKQIQFNKLENTVVQLNNELENIKTELADSEEHSSTLIEDKKELINKTNKLTNKLTLEKQISEKIIKGLQEKLELYKNDITNSSKSYSKLSIQNKELENNISKLTDIQETILYNLQDDKYIDFLVSNICTKNIPNIVKQKYIRFGSVFAKNIVKLITELKSPPKPQRKIESWLAGWFNQSADEEV